MLICDHIHRDTLSGKPTLLGVFDEIHPRAYPAELGPVGVYINLTNMRGRYALGLDWLRGDTEEELARIEVALRVDVQDPLTRVEAAVMNEHLPVPAPGRYVLRLRANGRHIKDLVIIAMEIAQ